MRVAGRTCCRLVHAFAHAYLQEWDTFPSPNALANHQSNQAHDLFLATSARTIPSHSSVMPRTCRAGTQYTDGLDLCRLQMKFPPKISCTYSRVSECITAKLQAWICCVCVCVCVRVNRHRNCLCLVLTNPSWHQIPPVDPGTHDPCLACSSPETDRTIELHRSNLEWAPPSRRASENRASTIDVGTLVGGMTLMINHLSSDSTSGLASPVVTQTVVGKTLILLLALDGRTAVSPASLTTLDRSGGLLRKPPIKCKFQSQLTGSGYPKGNKSWCMAV